ncbi:MAG: hypothetical protein GTO63_21170, partial [Anaerolineae bacterium]|nr:hypothetical protein [Anaerolineae bacterium]NIN97310.1 hypothetical protein [Anaerolineae bacterium]
MIRELASLPDPFVLVLDDYHAIQEVSIHGVMATFVEHQPRQMNLVLITREDPPLPLARLRVRGEMNEIRAADLQ